MAIPDNYIDKITKEGDSRPICPAADKVRVDNENFEGADLDAVLDEVAEAIEDAGDGYNPPAGGIPKTDLAQGVQASLDKADTAVQDNDYTHTDNNYTDAEKTKLAGLPTNPVTSISVNGTPQAKQNGNVSLVIEAGARGPKGDTGNVRVTGNGNVLIVNNLEDGGTDAALSAEMGKRLAVSGGTFAAAWAKSRRVTGMFCWYLIQTINGVQIRKALWHIGNSVFVDALGAEISIEAASAPSVPTISGVTDGAEVEKNTEITISPAIGAAVYYRFGTSGDWTASDVPVVLRLTNVAEDITLQAKCMNNCPNDGYSDLVEIVFTVLPLATPIFGAGQDTDIDENNVVSRGGSVVITGDKDGTLHYSVNGVDQTPIVGDGVNDPTASVQITGSTTIVAYIDFGNDGSSSPVTKQYTMAALEPPTFSKDSGTQLNVGGEYIGFNNIPSGVSIRYTTDGSIPTASSGTLYDNNAKIHVTTSPTTIKAIAIDNTYNDVSEVATATYTIKTEQIEVVVNDEVTMSLGDTGVDFVLGAPQNGDTTRTHHITIADINTKAGTSYSSFADHEFASLSFDDNTRVVEFDGCGLKVKSLFETFKNATNLEKAVDICVVNSTMSERASCESAFYGASKLANVNVYGTTTSITTMFKYAGSALAQGTYMTIDISDLACRRGRVSQYFAGDDVGANSAFQNARVDGVLDLSALNFDIITTNTTAFASCTATGLIVGDTFQLIGNVNNLFSSSIKTIKITTNLSAENYVVPALSGGSHHDWVASFITSHISSNVFDTTAKISVPSALRSKFDTAWENLSYSSNGVTVNYVDILESY